jgi:hypothetical protein
MREHLWTYACSLRMFFLDLSPYLPLTFPSFLPYHSQIKAFLDGFDNFGNETAQNQTEKAFCSDDTITKFVTCMDCTIAANSSISQSDAQKYIDCMFSFSVLPRLPILISASFFHFSSATIAGCNNDTGASLKSQTVQAKQPSSALGVTASTGGIAVGVLALAISSLL